MATRSLIPRLTDIVEASKLIRSEMQGVTLDVFEADTRKRWLVERGVEIISEALKAPSGNSVAEGRRDR